MSALKTRLLAQALVQKGFVEVKSHHRKFFLNVEEKRRSVHTKISHGEKEIGDVLASLIARQLSLTRKQLDDLVGCPKDKQVGCARKSRKMGISPVLSCA